MEKGRDTDFLSQMADTMKIPFNRSSLEGRELEYIFQAVTTGQIGGDQTFSRKCARFLEQVLGAKHALITTSGTHALEMSALLLNIQRGDEVIAPAFTFVSTLNAFVLRGATPVFCDIRPDTLNLDETKLEPLITSRTKAIVPVHYAGIACEMDSILEIAERKGVYVIEDNAHGLFGKYKGRNLGTLGGMAALSFHETKNITCGEGGALLINDARYLARAEIIREKGTNRTSFFRGEVNKYSWMDIGSSYVMSDVLAAFLFAQLEVWETIQAKRCVLWQRYQASLEDWAKIQGIQRAVIPDRCDPTWHLYYLILPSLEQRQRLIGHLKAKGILAVFHYLPLHLSPMGCQFGGLKEQCPITEDLSERLLRLPLYTSMSEDDQRYVIHSLLEFSCYE
jgi:dTDP-4-amino-4,6-dideoxygalactose transaminase